MVAFATRHNGGRSQINLGGSAGGEFPFLNHLKGCQGWTYRDNSSNAPPNELDSDGYPTTIVHSGVYTPIVLPPQSERPGDYKVTWTGNGTISNIVATTGNTSTSGFTFTPASDGLITFGISAIGSPRISDLKVFHVNDETAILAGEVFSPQFKAKLTEANFGVIRFVNSIPTNSSNITNWYTRKPLSYCFYVAGEARPNLYCGAVTTSNGKDFTASAPSVSSSQNGAAWSTLHDKDTVILDRFPPTASIGTITGATKTNPCVLTITGSTWAVNEYISISGVSGMTELNGAFCLVTAVTGTSVTINRDSTSYGTWTSGGSVVHNYSSSGNITAITKANPCVVTVDGSTFTNGESVYIDFVSGMTELNGNSYTITNVVGNQITLNVNSVGFTTFTAGNGGMVWHKTSTLNIGGTGAKNILSEYSDPLSLGGNSFPIANLNRATAVYDAQLNSWIKQGSDWATFTLGIENGLPPELCTQLCAEIGAHPWFCTPFLSCTPMTDWTTNLATYIRDNYNGDSTKPCPWMVPRFEPPNELWNTFSGFFETGYAKAIVNSYGWTADNYHEWYGKVLSTIGQDVNTVYGSGTVSTQKFYQVVCGVQTAQNGDSSSDPRLTSAAYVAQGTPQSGYTATAASNWTTHVCCANYFSPDEYNTATETSKAIEWVSATQRKQQELAYSYSDSSLIPTGVNSFTIPKVAALLVNWKAWAKRLGINKMCFYEGGYSPDYIGINATFKKATKANPNLTACTLGMYVACTKALTDSTFLAEFPSHYLLADDPNSSIGVWPILDGSVYSSNTPQFLAIKAFNAVARGSDMRIRIHG